MTNPGGFDLSSGTDDGGGGSVDFQGLDLLGVDLTGTGSDGPKVDPNDPNNKSKDSDCDGLSDAEEFANTYAGGKKTDPANADTDGDGVPDGVEVGRTMSVDPKCTSFTGDADPSSRTIPTEPDSDVDGIGDGTEDKNHDGKVDSGETNPNNPDSDGDGLKDGEEDLNHNGVVDTGETDPSNADTDSDNINDGLELKITKTDPLKADTDGDTCADGAEDLNQNGVVDPGESNANLMGDCGGMMMTTDTDSDGLPDKIEDANGNGVYDPLLGETDFKNPDTDGDGIPDGIEDKNKDGKVSIGETDPRRVDSDCDGLIDGPTKGTTLGEDQNANGVVDVGETNPAVADSDMDGVRDGIELGVTVNPAPMYCLNFMPDADPNTKTDPTMRDSDGDGIDDGAEDANQNGRVDVGELNPKDGTDGMGPVGKVCTLANLRPVIFKVDGQSDLQIALPPTFTEVLPMTVNGVNVGLIGYDSTTKVAFVVYRRVAPGANVTADEAAIRPAINGVGAVTNPLTQTFTTWDTFPAIQAFYDQAGGVDVKARANALANALAGAGAGKLVGNGGATGPFKLQAEYVHRSAQSAVVLIALTPTANFVEPAIFTVSDTAGGSALAQFGDANAVQCEKFLPKNGAVDFIFSVDDSGSMASSQQALANVATSMAAALGNSSVDWRIAMVTSTYTGSGGNTNVLRGFTRNIQQFREWLNNGSTCAAGRCGGNTATTCTNQNQCWIGTSGDSSEYLLQSAAKAHSDLTPSTTVESATKIRTGAAVVVILVGDADDQSNISGAQFSTFFNTLNNSVGGYTNRVGKTTVHGIVCPVGQTCNGETQNNPQKEATVITATGGVNGSIINANSIMATMTAIVNSAIAASGYKTQKPPIGASIKVAMDVVQNGAMCNVNDLPRSRVNGFDFDGVNRTINFFGACRPSSSTLAAAVSYRYWVDTTPLPNGNNPPCFKDPFFDPQDPDFCKGKLVCNLMTDTCECPPDCGGPPPAGKICNVNKLVCDYICTPDCGGACNGYKTCNTTSCACDCVQSATCAPGYVFVNSGNMCGCFCDGAALGCGPTYMPDLASCTCQCKPDCGGCATSETCDPNTCVCKGGIG